MTGQALKTMGRSADRRIRLIARLLPTFADAYEYETFRLLLEHYQVDYTLSQRSTAAAISAAAAAKTRQVLN